MILAAVKHSSAFVNEGKVSELAMLKKSLSSLMELLSHSTLWLFLAILVGACLGFISPTMGTQAYALIDPTIFILVFLLLFEVPIKGVFKGVQNLRFISIAWLMNFVLIPVVGFSIASFFSQPNRCFIPV